MERAFEFAGYEVQHVWGEGGHNGNHATAIFPDAMRWLWKDWPAPVTTGETKNATLTSLLVPGERWRVAGEGYKDPEGLAVDQKGDVFFTEPSSNRIHRIGSDGRVTLFTSASRGADQQAFGPDSRLYSAASAGLKITAYDSKGGGMLVAGGQKAAGIVVTHNGNIYICEPASDHSAEGKIWLIAPDGNRQVVDTGIDHPGGITMSPDQSLLYVSDTRSHWIYSFKVQRDGKLAYKQKYYWLHVPDAYDDSGAAGMCVDSQGLLYVTSRLGIQVCDQAGRVNCIIPTPAGRGTSLCLGGPNFDTLYVACGDRIYYRKLHTTGANAWAEPIKPPAPHL